MKKHIPLLLLMIFMLGGCGKIGQVMDGDGMVREPFYAQISQDEARLMMQNDDGHVIVDVRRADEYAQGHIPGAILIPNEEIWTEQPEHDVALNVESRNSMEYDPYAMGWDTPENTVEKRASVIGPYGEISIAVPDNWDAEAAPVDSEKLTYGLYGLILRPADVADGQIGYTASDSQMSGAVF